jgi:ribulose-phosphate 3-epimerase
MVKIAPSILNADFTCLKSQINEIMEAGIEWIHLDIMDGHFVPNITFGPMIVEAVRQLCDAKLDVHLMLQKPDQYLETFIKAGADHLTVHYEACNQLWRTIDRIHDLGATAGVTLNPATPIHLLEPILDRIDLALVLSVEPGFGGQEFIPFSLQKISYLHEQKKIRNLNFFIEVDGGINKETALLTVKSGADILVIGTTIFKSPNIQSTIREIEKTIEAASTPGGKK